MKCSAQSDFFYVICSCDNFLVAVACTPSPHGSSSSLVVLKTSFTRQKRINWSNFIYNIIKLIWNDLHAQQEKKQFRRVVRILKLTLQNSPRGFQNSSGSEFFVVSCVNLWRTTRRDPLVQLKNILNVWQYYPNCKFYSMYPNFYLLRLSVAFGPNKVRFFISDGLVDLTAPKTASQSSSFTAELARSINFALEYSPVVLTWV